MYFGTTMSAEASIFYPGISLPRDGKILREKAPGVRWRNRLNEKRKKNRNKLLFTEGPRGKAGGLSSTQRRKISGLEKKRR